MKMVIIVIVGVAFAGSVSAQTMYKCKNADGTMAFTQHPCSDSAEAIELKVIEPSKEEATRAQAEYRQRAGQTSLNYEERACLDRARRAAYTSADRRIRGYRERIAQLEYSTRFSANNLAGATRDSGLREQIAGLHQSVATEQAAADGLYASAEQRCAEARQRKESALEDEDGG